MAVKPSRWCGRCSAVHTEDCPNKPVWQKRVMQPSGRGGRPWQRKRKSIFERDGYQCQACMQVGKITFVTLHGGLAGICDHIIPLSEGGGDEDSNLQTLCKPCSDVKTAGESLRGRGGQKP